MPRTEVPNPLPVSARRRQLAGVVSEIAQLKRSAVAANLLLKREATLSRPASGQLSAILADMEQALTDLEARPAVILPAIRQEPDKLDTVLDVAFDASEFIYKLEALLDTMRRQLDHQPDGHLIYICELAYEQMPKLRFALYGEDMGP